MKKTLIWALCVGVGPAAGAAPAAPDGVYDSHLMVEQEVAVTSRLTGIVEKIHVDRGARVSRGQALASLDAKDLELEVRESKEEMELRRLELERAESLAEGKVLSRADLDERKARYEVALARYERTRALRDRAVIRAPFAGVISEKYVRIGQKVIEDENQPLFRLTAFEPLLARVYLPEEQLLRVRPGDPVQVEAVKFPSARTTGSIQFISPTVDPSSGTFLVIVKVLRGSSPALRPGVAVKIRFREGKGP